MSRQRKERRAAERAAVKDARQRLRLAELEAGGAPDRPIVLATSHLVEPTAKGKPCPACGGAVRVLDHVVEEHRGRSLRVADVKCAQCGAARRMYFTLDAVTLN